jgi:hypothetical protein
MKAKYQHYGNDCIVYDQVVCEDNIVVLVRSYKSSWFDAKPEIETKVCLTNSEARRLFHGYCGKFEKADYECVYKVNN